MGGPGFPPPAYSMHTRLVAWGAIAVVCTACATARPHTFAAPSSERRAAFVMDATELRPRDTRSLLSLVESRWPTLGTGAALRGFPRQAALAPIAAPLDRFGVYDREGTFLGGPEYLDAVFASNVTEVRRLTEMEAFSAFGRRHPAGAIVLTWAPGYRR